MTATVVAVRVPTGGERGDLGGGEPARPVVFSAATSVEVSAPIWVAVRPLI